MIASLGEITEDYVTTVLKLMRFYNLITLVLVSVNEKARKSFDYIIMSLLYNALLPYAAPEFLVVGERIPPKKQKPIII